MRRRLASLLAVFGLVAAGTFAFTGPASAAAPVCTGQGYPPAPHATIEVSTTTPLVNAFVKVSGIAFCGNEAVNITVRAVVVIGAHTNGTGSFDPQVKITHAGANEICGIGASGLADDRDCLTVVAKTSTSGGGGHGTSGSGTGGGTALTGTDIALLVLLAAVLLGGGGAALAAGRRRRQQSAA